MTIKKYAKGLRMMLIKIVFIILFVLPILLCLSISSSKIQEAYFYFVLVLACYLIVKVVLHSKYLEITLSLSYITINEYFIIPRSRSVLARQILDVPLFMINRFSYDKLKNRIIFELHHSGKKTRILFSMKTMSSMEKVRLLEKLNLYIKTDDSKFCHFK